MLTGKDVLPFLQALLTNDVARLTPGDGTHAAYLTPQGRMIADLDLYCRPEGVMVAVVSQLATPLADRFEQSVFSEDVRTVDVSATTDELLVVGPGAASVIASALGLDEPQLSSLPEMFQIGWDLGFVARTGVSVLPSYVCIVPRDRRTDVEARLRTAGAVPVSDALVESLRVQAGRPRFGVDMTEDTIPLEAGLLERAISTTKGCYVGQEVIIRILHRGGGRVARRLVTLRCEGQALARPGAALEYEGKVVGVLTSVAESPTEPVTLALGYLHRDVAQIDRIVDVAGTTRGRATVTGFAG